MPRFVLGCLVVLGCLAALLLAACGSGTYVGVGVGVGWGWYDYYGYYDPWGWSPYALTAGDFDGDGDVDVAIADGKDGAVYLLRGTNQAKLEAGSGAPFIGRTGRRWIRAGHFNADAVLDLVLVGEDSSRVEVYLGDKSGGFLPAPTSPLRTIEGGVLGVCIGRMDADAFGDLVVLDRGGVLRVFPCDGRGGFGASRTAVDLEDLLSTGRGGVAIACASFDGARGLDVAVVSAPAEQVVVLSGGGDGTLTRGFAVPARVPATLLDAAACPGLTEDGDDVAILYASEPENGRTAHVSRILLHGPDAGTLTPALDVGEATHIVTADMTGDGLPDLLVVDPATGALRVYRAERR